MVIREIFIEEFGGLTSRSLTLKDGFNLIKGENESGKSTLCAFIKYVFYGFSGVKEKERYSSLATGRSSGAVIFSHCGKDYRIERRDAGNVRYVTVYDESTSTEYNEWKKTAQTPGEYFFGVSAELYSRSIYVSQDGGAKLDGGSAEAVSNLLLSGDEAINLRRAEKSLDAARKALKLKKGSGGLIYDTSIKIASLKEQRRKALELKEKASQHSIELKNAENEIAKLSEKYQEVCQELDRAKSSRIKHYLAEADKVNDGAARTKQQIEELKKRYTINGFLPTENYESKIISAERDILGYLEQSSGLQTQLDTMRKNLGEKTPKSYDAYCEMGKKSAILSEYKHNQSSIGTFKVFIFAAIFVFIISLFAIGATLIGLLESGAFLYVLLCCSAFVGTISIVFRYFPSKRIKRMHNRLGVDDQATLEAVCRECDDFERMQGVHLKSVTDAIAKVREKLNSKKNEESILLKSWGKTSAEQALSEYRAYVNQYQELKGTLDGYLTRISVAEAYLEAYTEDDINKARADERGKGNSVSTVTEQEAAELKKALDLANEKQNAARLAIAETGASGLDIEAISAALECEMSKYSELEDKYSAIILALEALEAAENGVRKTVSPYLGETAGEYFVDVTDGRYEALKVDTEMNMSYISNGSATLTDSAYLSGGSADLAWLCLRLALHGKLSENSNVPLVLDECLVYFDDERLRKISDVLLKKAENGTQIILFSASSREERMIGDKVSVTVL